VGDTFTALRAGSIRYQLVAAIEGYDKLLTNGSTAAAVTAWAGTDWSSAIGGLFVTGYNEQTIDPWEPFRGGGRMSLQVVPTPADGDVLGVAIAKKNAGAETALKATADRIADTITVADTSSFASSGSAFIGNECFAYSGKTGTTFTGCTRGKYSPFLTEGGTGFAGYHRVGFDALAVALEPLVTELPRVWVGKWVGIWMHRVVGGVLDTKAQAQLLYAGRVVALYDDEATGAAIVELKHVLDVVKETVIGRETYTAKTKEGLFIPRKVKFGFGDFDGSTVQYADDLVVVAAGASGANQINEGYYTLDQIDNFINTWLHSERAAGRIKGTYSLEQVDVQGVGIRSRINWRIPGTGPKVLWVLALPHMVRVFLGYDPGPIASKAAGATTQEAISDQGDDDTDYHLDGKYEPKKAVLFEYNGTSNFQVTDERGVFFDQTSYLPTQMQSASYPDSWGVFLLDDKYLVVAHKDGAELQNAFSPRHPFTTDREQMDANHELNTLSIPISSDAPGSMSVRQVLLIEGRLSDLVCYFFFSSGTPYSNSSDLDILGYGLGLAIPWELCQNFFTSVVGLPMASSPLLLVLDQPTKFVDIFAADLVLRRAFLRWAYNASTGLSGLEFATWKTPTAGDPSALALPESTKAASSTQRDGHRSASSEQGTWKRPIIKILYDRNILSKSRDAGYRSTIAIEDKVAIDDAGGEAAPFTIEARNVYAQYAQTGAALEDLVQLFLASAPLFTRDASLVRRSIASKYFEGLSVGDVVLVTDGFARDPDTGLRGVSARPALVVRHRAQWGGAQAGSAAPAPAGGEVDLFLLAQNRIAAYVPCAQVDDTAGAGGFSAGYNAGTKTLRCYDHKHSETSEAVDASHFAAGYKVRIVEIDPATAGSPLTWDREVASVSSSDIMLTVALSSPAWDATKHYRIIFDDYGDAVTAQQSKCFQADDADYRIANLRNPFTYGVGGGAAPFTYGQAADPIALPPTLSYGDGAPFDVGHQVDLMRLLNNLLDYKCARISPVLHSTELSGAAVTGTWLLCDLCPIQLTEELLTASYRRFLYVAPHMKSSDGTSASVRVSLCRDYPGQDTLNDIDRGAIYGEVTFTTSSTAYATPSAQAINIRNLKGSGGVAWLLVELTAKARSWGLAFCQEGNRS